jgi:NitT/TauT family transport system permease protein/taurine transport system permease protein
MLKKIAYIGLLLFLIVMWEIIARYEWVMPALLPSPVEVLTTFIQLLIDKTTYNHLGVTFQEIFVAYLIAALLGILLGLFLGGIPYLGDVFESVIVSISAVPIVILYPFSVLFFGIGSGSKIAFATLSGFFPIVINTTEGVRHIHPEFIRAARSMGAGPYQLFLKVIFPAALPTMLSGLRIGMVFVLLAVIGGEFISAKAGIGYKIAQASDMLDTPALFSYIFIVLMIATLINSVLSQVERKFQSF